MAKIARFNGDVRAFGSTATGTDRTIFGDVTQSDTLDANINANFLTGWGILTAGAKPPKQYFNGALYTATQLIAYLHEVGVPEWNTNQKFYIGSLTLGSDGVVYSSVTGTDPTPNTGTNPATVTDEAVWKIAANPYKEGSITHDITVDADYTLTALQNKYGRIEITDTGVLLTTARNIIVDNVQKRFVFINNTLQSLTVKTSAGTGIQVPVGQTMDLYNDGTNVVEAVSNSTGFKNLLHNPNKILQQRGTTGGRRQVIDASNVELSGSYVISHGGSATVRIYEATTLGASDAVTTWSELTAGASASGTVVTVTAGKFIKVEFSTTDFSFAQFEKGTIPTSYEQRAELEPYLCLPYFVREHRVYLSGKFTTATSAQFTGKIFKGMRKTPSITVSGITDFTLLVSGATTIATTDVTVGNIFSDSYYRLVGTIASGGATDLPTFILGNTGSYVDFNAEHFTDTYFEDRWF